MPVSRKRFDIDKIKTVKNLLFSWIKAIIGAYPKMPKFAQ
jgi:hypothetical protein